MALRAAVRRAWRPSSELASLLRRHASGSTEWGASRLVPEAEIEAANEELRNHFLVDHGEQEAQPATARGPTAQPSREPAAMDPRQEHLQAAVGQPLPWANAGGQEMGQPTGSRGGQRSHEPSWSVSGAAGSAAAGGGSGEGGRLTHVDSAGKANMVDVSQKQSSVRTAVASAVVRFASAAHSPFPWAAGSTALRAAGSASANQASTGPTNQSSLGQSQGAASSHGQQSGLGQGHQGLAGYLGGGQRELLAQLSGIRAAKMTSLLIPLCHNINLSKVQLQVLPGQEQSEVGVSASATAVGQTGVEMEALAAVTFGALNLLGQGEAGLIHGRVTDIQLDSKTGGKSGDYSRTQAFSGSSSGDGTSTSRDRSSSTSSDTSGQAVARDTFVDAATSTTASTSMSTRMAVGGATFTITTSISVSPHTTNVSISPHTSTGVPPPSGTGSVAVARLALPAATWRQLLDNVNKKGDVLAVSQAAGVMAAEQAGALLPTAGVGLGHAQVHVELDASQPGHVHITAQAGASSGSGLGARLLTAAAVSALTVYDMCKASSKSIVIEEVALLQR